MTNPYEAVTARIIESLKAGIIPWAKPWKGNGSNNPFPRNFKTGAPYRERTSSSFGRARTPRPIG